MTLDTRRFRPRIEHGAIVAATLSFVYRFVRPDLALFTNDEPHLLAAAEAEAHGQGWLLASPVQGTQHLHYGPVPTWLYGLVHIFFGASPQTSVRCMGAAVTLGQIAFLALLTRRVRGGAYLFSSLALLVAASPFDFAWSRVAWDNTLLIGTFACGVILLSKEELEAWSCVAAGVLFGIAIGTHLMVLPALSVVVAVMFLTRRDRLRETAQKLGIAAVPAVTMNLPYALYLAGLLGATAHASHAVTTGVHVPPPFALGDAITMIVTTFLQPARILTTAGISYFFDDAFDDFRTTTGGLSFLLYDEWWAVLLAVTAFTGLWLAYRRGASRELRRLAALALFAWLGHALFLLMDGLDPHPHYQHPIWWTIPTGIALLFVHMRVARPQLANGLLGVLAASSLVHVAVLPLWIDYIDRRGGTRGIHFTTPVGSQEEFVRHACDLGESVAIENHTVIFDSALEYLGHTERACANRRVVVCHDECTSVAGARVVVLAYVGAVGGRLEPAR